METQEKKSVVRTTLRLDGRLHLRITNALAEIRFRTGKKQSIDAAAHAAFELWLQVGTPMEPRELTKTQRERIAADFVPGPEQKRTKAKRTA